MSKKEGNDLTDQIATKNATIQEVWSRQTREIESVEPYFSCLLAPFRGDFLLLPSIRCSIFIYLFSKGR
jgi:hypothetical protein